MSFVVLPAIDLRGGRVVRLYQGDYARQTDYAVTPVDLARRYAAEGAGWLHVVDLDGARSGTAANLDVITSLAAAGLRVQAGGGVRTADDVARLLDAGVERVVVGSVAVRDPACMRGWLERWGASRLVIALDARFREGAWRLASAGWECAEASTLGELAPRYASSGASHLLCTDIDRDGTLSGPNLALLAYLKAIAPRLEVLVSGGVRTPGDVAAARAAGAGGVVLGRALLEGRFTLAQALAC